MSKERELLEKIKKGDDDGDFFITSGIYTDIQTMLAQREPLSDKEINDFFSKNQWKTFLQLARILEKEYGLGASEPLSDDVIDDIFVNNQWLTFLQLVRVLEKAYGIGVDNGTH